MWGGAASSDLLDADTMWFRECGNEYEPPTGLIHRGRTVPPSGQVQARTWTLLPGPAGAVAKGDGDAVCRISRDAGLVSSTLIPIGPGVITPGDDALQPHLSSGRPGPTGGRLSDTLALTVTVVYREVAFEVPADFYARWALEWAALDNREVGGDVLSSVADCLDHVWAHLHAAREATTRLDDEDIDELLGCYTLGSTGGRSMFWRAGWGPPRQAYRTAVRLAAIYADYIDDSALSPFEPVPGSGLEWSPCDGLGSFVRTLLRGKAATRSFDDWKCRLTIHFDARDDRFETTAAENCARRGERRCGRWYMKSHETEGRKFDLDFSTWQSTAWSEWYRAYAPAHTTVPGLPKSRTVTLAYGGGWRLVSNPIFLAWRGFVADRILHRARLAYDLARSRGDLGLGQVAQQLGAYALLPMVDDAQLYIHEIGHSYLGSGHCEEHCCFDAAATAWACHVRGRLGLPAGTWHSGAAFEGSLSPHRDFSGAEVTYQNPDWSRGSNGGSCTRRALRPKEGSGRYNFACTLEESGVPGAGSSICFDGAWEVRGEDALEGARITWEVPVSQRCDDELVVPSVDRALGAPKGSCWAVEDGRLRAVPCEEPLHDFEPEEVRP